MNTFPSDPSEEEEANLAPLADFFFVILMVVLLHASFIKVSVPSEIAAAAKTHSNPVTRPIPILVVNEETWQVAGREVKGRDQIRAALDEALAGSGDEGTPPMLGISFAPDLPSKLSWEIRARLQHEWCHAFVELPPHIQ